MSLRPARLYWRIWLAVLASLLVFAVAAGFLWRSFADFTPLARHAELIAEDAERMFAEAAPGQEIVVIERLAGRHRADLALHAGDGRPLARAGRPLPPPSDEHVAWFPGRHGPPAWTINLADGRRLVVRPHQAPRGPFGGPRGGPFGSPHGGSFGGSGGHPPGGTPGGPDGGPPGGGGGPRLGPPSLLTGPFGGPSGGFFVGLALVALAVGVGTYPIVRRLTRRLERLQAAVDSLGRGDFGARVAVEGNDEVALLAKSFNHAATRIEQLVAGHRLLLANASHELRTPLARVRVGLELLAAEPSAARRGEIERDIAELDALVDEILLASRLDAQPRLSTVEEIDLLGLAAEVASRHADVAVEGNPVTIAGDRRLLARLFGNLLDNAERHGRPPVSIQVNPSAEGATLVVADHGDGIAPAERQRIFEPFQRLAGRGAGTGLGLSLVRTIARLHGGEASVEDGEDSPRGARFVVRLPARPAA